MVPGTTMRPASFTGSGRRSTAESNDHVADAAPIAHASVTIETTEAPVRFVSRRIASLSSSILLPRGYTYPVHHDAYDVLLNQLDCGSGHAAVRLGEIVDAVRIVSTEHQVHD